MNDKVLAAVSGLLQILVTNFGPWGTIGIVVGGLSCTFAWKVYQRRNADKAIDRALEEKERSIQRLANQERTWRKIFLTKGLKLTPQEAEEILQLEIAPPAKTPRSTPAVVPKKKK